MAFYDVALSNSQEFFSSRIQELCGVNNLSFFLIEPLWAQQFLEKLEQGDVSVGVLIDKGSDPYLRGDLYYRIAREVKASGGHVIDDPDRSPVATHKGKFHAILKEHGVAVPETIIVNREDIPGLRVTEEMLRRIGSPFVAKPSWGFGRRGVILNATSETDVARSAELAPDSDSFMLQKRVVPQTLEGKPAWFRVFYVCGEIIPCWWHPTTGDYQMVSPLQRKRYGLVAVDQMVHKIAQLSQMEFFSTEITLTDDGHFIAIDYLNDECDMHAKSYHPSGVPDEIVRRVAHLMVQKALQVNRKHPFENELVDRDAFMQRVAQQSRA